MYEYGAFCDIDNQIEYGAFCPITCPVVKHGVMSAELLKVGKTQGVMWRNAGEVQSTRTSELRAENPFFGRIYSGVL